MELAIIVGFVLTLLAIDNFITTHQQSAKSHFLTAETAEQGRPRAIRTEPIIDDSPQIAVTHDDAERTLTARLLTGVLDRATYRGGMAALAATEQQVSGVSPLRMVAADGHLLEQLSTAMPGLPSATLFAAVALAHSGATVEDLTRLLGLTTAQALRVVITTPGTADRQI
jgi:hypothetical protein